MAFKKGQIANPKGRPKGSKNKTTLLKEILEKDGQLVAKKALEMAKDGDPQMIRLVMDKLLPNLKATEHTLDAEQMIKKLVINA